MGVGLCLFCLDELLWLVTRVYISLSWAIEALISNASRSFFTLWSHFTFVHPYTLNQCLHTQGFSGAKVLYAFTWDDHTVKVVVIVMLVKVVIVRVMGLIVRVMVVKVVIVRVMAGRGVVSKLTTKPCNPPSHHPSHHPSHTIFFNHLNDLFPELWHQISQ